MIRRSVASVPEVITSAFRETTFAAVMEASAIWAVPIAPCAIKAVVIAHSRTAYVLSDHSKFDQIASVTFARLNQVQIITDRIGDRKYLTAANIREVM